MSLSYPIAIDAEAALSGKSRAARTRYEAESLSNGLAVEGLTTDWFKPGDQDVEALKQQAETETARGFVQVYEDGEGHPVLAVTYWKLSASKLQKAAPAKSSPEPADEDDTDDLYFRHGRTKKSRARRKKYDPNQLDLFGTPPPAD